MRSSILDLLLGAVVLTGIAAACSGVGAGAAAEPVAVEGPADFRVVVDGAVAEARRGLPAVADCIGGFTVRADWDLEDRASYDDGTIDIRVPATAPRIEELVLHELAHHLDATCPLVGAVRADFLGAQESSHPWHAGPTWEETPAEQFAEAVTMVVVGRQRAHHVRVSPEAVAVVRRWGTAAD